MDKNAAASFAAKVSLNSIILYVVLNAILLLANAVPKPWHLSPVYLIGANSLAAVAILSGIYALRSGETLALRDRSFAKLGIMGGIFYFVGYAAAFMS